jgi:hypothetical protein
MKSQAVMCTNRVLVIKENQSEEKLRLHDTVLMHYELLCMFYYLLEQTRPHLVHMLQAAHVYTLGLAADCSNMWQFKANLHQSEVEDRYQTHTTKGKRYVCINEYQVIYIQRFVHYVERVFCCYKLLRHVSFVWPLRSRAVAVEMTARKEEISVINQPKPHREVMI